MSHKLRSSGDVYHYTMGNSFFVSESIWTEDVLIATGPIIKTPGVKAQRIVVRQYLEQIVVHTEYFNRDMEHVSYETGYYFPKTHMQQAMKMFTARIDEQITTVERVEHWHGKHVPLPIK